MIKKVLPYILVAASLASCMNANLAFDGDDLLPPQLRMSEPATSGNSLDVTFEATLSETIGKEKCGFYLSMDENFASSEKVSADHIDKDKVRFSYTKRIKDYGHRWYCKAYASNGKIEIHSRVSSYLVKPFSDYVSAEVPKIVSSVDDRAELSFTVSAVEGILLTECGVCYGLSADELSVKSSHVSSEGLTGEQTVSISGLTVGQVYYVCSYAREGENIVFSEAVSLSTVSSVPEAVDLGLSVKWASFNIGATKPEEFGGYYQWAGLEDVSDLGICFDWENGPYHTGSNFETGWTKYVHSNKPSYWSGSGSPDNKTVLDPNDDVAHVKLGGKWRMPTDVEWTELMKNCTWTWTTQNGVKGYKVTSKKSGYTSRSIFLPAAGYRDGDFLFPVGSYGGYWSSSLYTDYPYYVYCVYFYSADVYRYYFNRLSGLSVRPVYGDKVSVTGVSLNKSSLSLNTGETFTLSATVTPSNAAEKSVSWSSSNTSVATVDQSGNVTAVKAGSATITVTTTDGGYTATCSVTVKSPEPVTPEAVDLGLSVKWASFNIGATKPEEYGGYYQWAGLEDVTSISIYLDWSNCPYHSGNSSTGWTKYVPSDKSSYWSGSGSPDNKTVLDPSDDVAHVKLGGKWRMPTEAEWTELRENCTWTWTTQNGVKGYKVSSKKSGYTSKSIFLPAAGYRSYDRLHNVGSDGYYWSSSLYTDYPISACALGFYSDYVNTSSGGRCCGQSVRPVYGDKVSVTGVSLNKSSLNLNIGETSTLSATVTPSNAAEKSVSWSSNNTSVATVDQSGNVTAVKAGNATITVRTTDGGYTATCSVSVTEPVPEAVDLGLSVKWASFNIGATKPEEYGGYYQWGGTQDVTSTSINLNWDNCPYHTGFNEDTGWIKYVPSDKSSYWSGSGSPDNKTILDSSDDVAHVKLGGKWRMPTEAEWTELRVNCTWTWTTQNGVNGYKVTSKKSGYTSKSIFLPAAGFRFYDRLDDVGSDGHYWSSSLLATDVPYGARNVYFGSGVVYGSGNDRCYGYSVRPVSE